MRTINTVGVVVASCGSDLPVSQCLTRSIFVCKRMQRRNVICVYTFLSCFIQQIACLVFFLMYVWVKQSSDDCLTSFASENSYCYVCQVTVASDYDFMQFSYLKNMWYCAFAVLSRVMLKYFLMMSVMFALCSFLAFLFVSFL